VRTPKWDARGWGLTAVVAEAAEIKKVIDLLKLRPVDNSDQVLATRTVVFTGTFDPSKPSASS